MPVFTNCNVCGRKLHYKDEDRMGMCRGCAGVDEELSPDSTPPATAADVETYRDYSIDLTTGERIDAPPRAAGPSGEECPLNLSLDTICPEHKGPLRDCPIREAGMTLAEGFRRLADAGK